MELDTGTPKMIARKEGGIGWMIFNQPEKHNAVSYEMWLAVPKIIAAFEADPAVRVIVLAGAGEKAFVSGADISEFEKKRGSEDAIKVYDDAGNAAHAALNSALKPMVSMILVMACSTGSFSRISETSIIDPAKAKDLISDRASFNA